jgi:signal peptidase
VSAGAGTCVVRDEAAMRPAVAASGTPGLRWANRGATAILACVVLLLGAGVALRAGGVAALVDRSESMAPAIHAGDVLLTREARADRVRAGDIVTLRDPASGQLITHRAVTVSTTGTRTTIVTRGDANVGSERWVVPADATVRRLAARIPLVGHALLWLVSPALRLALGALGFGLLAAALLRGRRAA